jgi:hypothetical protein
MKDLTDLVTNLKTAMLNSDDSDSPIVELLEYGGVKAIRCLLLMMDYPEDLVHEKYCVTHAVEGFPRETYFHELISTSREMVDVSPRFLEFLLARIMNSEKDLPLFLTTTNSASRETVVALIQGLEGVRTTYNHNATILRQSNHALAHLKHLAGSE